MSILSLNDLALKLVANDFSKTAPPPANAATNGGPTKTSRALAIIHLAAHDAYSQVTGVAALKPKLAMLPALPAGIGNGDADGTAALLGAGIHAAEQLYPDQAGFIASETAAIVAASEPIAFDYGKQVADAWLSFRSADQSSQSQSDKMFNDQPGRHRPDPLNPNQDALGRNWGKVKPFVLSDVAMDAPLDAPPDLTSQEYALAFDQVIEVGKNDVVMRDPDFRRSAAVGIFWGYDGANLIGTPPRLYNQVVRKITDPIVGDHPLQIKILTAINVAMADAGIAAWHWKYQYDFWRPVVGIREAEEGFGPTGLGDQNNLRGRQGDPFWLPLGAPKSNPPKTVVSGSGGSNGTPNFPAYPSGHATFGSACFETVASLLGMTPEEISVTFISDEFNGVTTDNTGATRPKWVQTFTLREAIEQNKISRIYLGVHWDFDATGGEIVGKAVSEKVVADFM
jgi:membrane-associated phospholipid phosphatase